MPEPKNPPVAAQDDKGFVHIELNASAGSTVTQALDESNSQPQSSLPSDFPPNQSVAAMPSRQPEFANMPAPPSGQFNPNAHQVAPSPPPFADKSPQVAQASQQLQQAQQKQTQAKQETEAALKKVQQLEQDAKATQEKLQNEISQARQKVNSAKQQIQEAQQQQQEGQQQASKLQAKDGASGLSIAGYSPGDIAQALVKPPEPSYSSGPTVDTQTQQQIQKQVQETSKAVQQTQKQVKEADKQIKTAEKYAEKSKQQQDSIIQKIASLLDKLTGDSKKSQPLQNPSKAFMIIGLAMVILTVLLLPFTNPIVWILIGLMAIVQLGMGAYLKKKAK